MRRQITNIIAVLLFALVPPVQAQQDSVVHHRLGFALQGGTSFLFFSPTDAKSDFGYGGGVSLLYELSYRHLLFRTGVGGDITFNRTHLSTQSAVRDVQEYPGMQYHFTFDPYRELQRYATLYVPVYIGGVWGGFHLMVGTKVGVYPFWGASNITAERTIHGTDPDVVNPMYELYTHGMERQELTASQPLHFKQINLMASAEMGMCFDPWMKADSKSHVYLALFADYGVLSIHDAQANRLQDELIVIRAIDDISLSSMLGNPAWESARLNNLFAGLKLTCVFDVSASRNKTKKQPAPKPVVDTLPKTEPQPVPVEPEEVKTDETVSQQVETDETVSQQVKTDETVSQQVETDTYVEGQTFVLENLYFATAKHIILPSSEPDLQKLLEMMQHYPERRIRITGHTDDVGKDGDNWVLSQRRAISVKRWLFEHGIDPYRMETDGKGETCPRVPNNSPENRQLNRRVEIMILQ